MLAPVVDYLARQYRGDACKILLSIHIEAHSENSQCLNQFQNLKIESGNKSDAATNLLNQLLMITEEVHQTLPLQDVQKETLPQNTNVLAMQSN